MNENIIIVDDEQFALQDLQQAIKEALPKNDLISINCFDTPTEALEFAKNNFVSVAFLDIEMGGMTGLFLAKYLKEINGNTNIIFVTGYSEYALDAYTLYPTDYLIKPVTSKAINNAMKNLRHPVQPILKNKLQINTFGNFEVFVDGKPLLFARSKTKELFAYLVNKKGALCSNNEIISVLWEKKEDSLSIKSYYQNLTADLNKTLKDAGVQDIIIKKRGQLGIAIDKVSCDFYDFLNGINVNRYMGEYMNQYSWAEFTNAHLVKTS